jgi:copper(I)-binding protein
MRRKNLIVPFALVALAGCTASPGNKVDNSVAAIETGTAATPTPALALTEATVQLPAVPGRPGAAYFVLNVGPDAKGKLVAVNVTHFKRAELHQSKMVGGAMTMDPVDSLPLTPGKPILFAPGSFHVMLFEADNSLKPGSTTDLTLTFDSGKTVSAAAKVTAAGGEDMGGMKM